jgi:hypothetical protein
VCRAEADRKQAEAAQAEQEQRVQLERAAAARRYNAASRGEASAQDLKQLEADGYLLAGGRLIHCPICGHDRFSQLNVLLSSRAAAFFNTQWASDSADTRTCQGCGYVLWFKR